MLKLRLILCFFCLSFIHSINIYHSFTEWYSSRWGHKDTQERLNNLEAESSSCIKKVGTIRYDAFRENHANLSFAVALLDEQDNGFIINGVYARENTTTYLKEIREGKSLFELSEEEKQALYTAKES